MSNLTSSFGVFSCVGGFGLGNYKALLHRVVLMYCLLNEVN